MILAGFCTRCGDTEGISSIVRCLGLEAAAYVALRRNFHSSGLDLKWLTRLWIGIVLRIFSPYLACEGSRFVIIADGLTNPKEGRKMPGVRLLHQESTNNSKAEWVMAHSCQCVCLLVKSAVGSFFAVPLAGRIHGGVKFTNRDRRTLYDRLTDLLESTGLFEYKQGFYLVADAYYACASMVSSMVEHGSHLVTRVRSNAVAYRPAVPPEKPKPGRPRLYGAKLVLKELFDSMKQDFKSAPSTLYGDGPGVDLRYLCLDLLWRPTGCLLRFVLVDHPTRGRWILFSTDLCLAPLRLIDLYGHRFKIEVAFKAALHGIGTFAYRFWMRAMTQIRRGSGTQHLHRASEEYRLGVRRKLAAFEVHIQLGLIAQGLLQFIAISSAKAVWLHFRGWLVTMNPHAIPSEAVTARALAGTLPEFLQSTSSPSAFKKFILQRLDPDRSPIQYLFSVPDPSAA